MRRLLITLLLAAALLALLVAPPLAGATATCQPSVITTFPLGIEGLGSFAESMAADSRGNLYVSITYFAEDTNTGQLWRVSPDGRKKLMASMDVSAVGVLTGVAIDACDRVYVGVWDFSFETFEPAVYRLDRDTLTQVAALPVGSFPNGLAFHDGRLYVSDSTGCIWRVRISGGVVRPTEPWVQDALLAPEPYIGINGIAFLGDCLYGVVYDTGRVVRVPLRRDGSAGAVSMVAQDERLATGDGIAFDVLGRLWITMNGTDITPSGGLCRVSRKGAVTEIAKDPGWLNYPTQPVFGRTLRSLTTLFILNGAFNNYDNGTEASLIALPTGVIGLPLH